MKINASSKYNIGDVIYRISIDDVDGYVLIKDTITGINVHVKEGVKVVGYNLDARSSFIGDDYEVYDYKSFRKTHPLKDGMSEGLWFEVYLQDLIFNEDELEMVNNYIKTYNDKNGKC